MGPAGDLGRSLAPVLLASWRPARSQAGAQVTSSAGSDLDPKTSEQASAHRGPGRPQARPSPSPGGAHPAAHLAGLRGECPVPAPRRVLRAATGGPPPGHSGQQLEGPGFRADVQMACECPGPGGAGQTEEHAACRVSLRPTRVVVVACAGGLSTACWHLPATGCSLGALPHRHVRHPPPSRCPSSACQPRVLGAGPALGPAPECSSHPQAAVPHLDFCFSTRPPCRPPRTPLQPHLPSQTRGLESQLAAFAAPSRGPAPQETECGEQGGGGAWPSGPWQ